VGGLAAYVRGNVTGNASESHTRATSLDRGNFSRFYRPCGRHAARHRFAQTRGNEFAPKSGGRLGHAFFRRTYFGSYAHSPRHAFYAAGAAAICARLARALSAGPPLVWKDFSRR